jgi:hypothetical protein
VGADEELPWLQTAQSDCVIGILFGRGWRMREKLTVRIVFREKGLEDGLGGVRVFGLSPLLVERGARC